MPLWLVFIVIGSLGGIASGLFGIGGGILIVPLLVYWAGFTQHQAVGTSLAVLLPPVGLAAVVEYYRQGNVNLHAAMLLAVSMIVCVWLGAWLAHRISGPHLRLAFGLFVFSLGIYLVWGACKRLGWL